MALKPFETTDSIVVARPTGFGRFQAEIAVRGGVILADEPESVGGGGTGPTPYELLSAALAACTAMTMRLYAERKGWDLPPLRVEVAHSLLAGTDGAPPQDLFTRHIAFDDTLDPERATKLLEIADKCPVHRTFMRGFAVNTRLVPPSEHVQGEPAVMHEQEMERACED
jgi:putative redox protein